MVSSLTMSLGHCRAAGERRYESLCGCTARGRASPLAECAVRRASVCSCRVARFTYLEEELELGDFLRAHKVAGV